MLPSSRIQSKDNPELIFQKKTEVFCSQFRTDNDLICIQKTSDWTNETNCICLHCSEKIQTISYPAVKYHDPLSDKYFVFGFFCRPCCSLGHVRDEVRDPRSILWTQIILKKFFSVQEFRFAPPRRCLEKYGGKMTLEQFYGEDKDFLLYKQIFSFPFVTFSMYAEVQKTDGLRGLRRPLVRNEPVQEQEQTEKVPLILEYLATKGSTKPEIKKRKKNSTLEKVAPSGSLLSYIVK